MKNFTYLINATAPGCHKEPFVYDADDENEAHAYVREEASDYFGVRAEHVVLKTSRVEPNF